MSFAKLGLSTPILNAVAKLGYTQPTSIQKQAIPAILLDRNLLAASQTGTGKTASFVLPLLEKLFRNRRYNGQTKVRGKRVRILVLTPTRELATQVEESIAEYGKELDFTSMALYGGVDEAPQKERLIEGVDFLVATPGRLVDMVHQRALHFDE